MDLSLLLIVCVNCMSVLIGVEGKFRRMTILEEEVEQNDEWFVRLHCHLINPSNISASCQSFTWSHESETLDGDNDVYQIETLLGNSSSQLTIPNPSDSENSYTCTAECDSQIYKIVCWVDFRQKEAIRICSERQIRDIIISATTAPKTTRKKTEELKIGISIVCVMLIGMTVIVIIKCRLKRKEALKHARAMYENANQCLIYSNGSAPTCQRYNLRRSYPLPDEDHSPIYRPQQRQTVTALPNRNRHRISAPVPRVRNSFISSSEIPLHNRLVLQEMTDGSQLVFIPGNAALPSYEDSISSSPRNSRIDSFCRLSSFIPSQVLHPSYRQTEQSVITNSNVLTLSEETGRLSSPPSYTSMVQMNSNDLETEPSTDSISESTACSEGSSNENRETNCTDDIESPPSISVRTHVPSISRYQPYPIGRPPPAYQERPDE